MKYFYFFLFQSSDYYSSGENRLPGVLTPPTAPPICLSIPRNVMQNQYNFCSYLSQCHELWEQADIHVVRDVRGACEGESTLPPFLSSNTGVVRHTYI